MRNIILRKKLSEEDAHLIKLAVKYNHLSQINRIISKKEYVPMDANALSFYSLGEVERLCGTANYELFEIDEAGNEKEIFPEEVAEIFKK